MTDLLMRIAERGTATPWMTAVRLGGRTVTYGELSQQLNGYRAVVGEQQLSDSAALAAALMSLLPEALLHAPAQTQAQWIADACMWLGRGLADDGQLPAAV